MFCAIFNFQTRSSKNKIFLIFILESQYADIMQTDAVTVFEK